MKNKSVVVEDAETIKKLFRVGAIADMSQKAELHPLLAAYLAEKGILKNGFLKLAGKDRLAKDKLAIIRHLWSHGFICRFSLEGDDCIRVHRKGIRPGEDRTQYLLKVIPKSWKPKFSEILEAVEFAGRLRKELIFAYLDGERVQFMRLGRATFE